MGFPVEDYASAELTHLARRFSRLAFFWITELLIVSVSFVVFAILDLVDRFLCVVFWALDSILDSEITPCYCKHRLNGALPMAHRQTGHSAPSDECKDGVSLSYKTEWDASVLMSNLQSHARLAPDGSEIGKNTPMASLQSNGNIPRRVMARWSDCGCSVCTSWQSVDEELLYVHVEGKGHENVIFIHGFLSSSALWSEKVIPHLPDTTSASYRLFGIDLLGFGKSPKPRSCSYSMADHIKKIEESVLHRYNIATFHLVAHSMGCMIALALAAAHVDSIKTITLVAPPYFPAPANEVAASYVLRQLAPQRIWPLTAYGASVMSWYEHVGRGLCFLLCKQHGVWECVLSTLTLNRVSRFAVRDFMQHTHHSAWHIFHNVICGEAHALDGYLSTLERVGCSIHVLHGADDTVVPIHCSYQLEKRYGNLKLEVLDGANHFTVIYGQEKVFSHRLDKIWRNGISNTICSRRL